MSSQPIPPSGSQVALRAGPYEAVVTEVGAGLQLLTYDGADLIDPYDKSDVVTGCRGQLLQPWPTASTAAGTRWTVRYASST